MSKFEYIGLPTYYNPETCELTIRVDFITPEMQGELEDAVKEGKSNKFTHKVFKKAGKSYEQQKFYYALLREILIKSDIMPFKENMEILDEEIRLELFPVDVVDFGDRQVPRPLRMKEMSHRQMARVIERVLERYSYLNINFGGGYEL